MKGSFFHCVLNAWPPLFFNSIRVQHLHDVHIEARVILRLRPRNRSSVRGQVGGNPFAMTDPFWML